MGGKTSQRTARAVLVPGGRTWLGSDDHYPEERPVRATDVPGLWVDEHPVTNAEFRRFVADTGWTTAAEQPPEPMPGERPGAAAPGSMVFAPPAGPVPLDDWRRWWAWVEGAFWRRPGGPGSDLNGRDLHPVVHVSDTDAAAYAAWAGKRLPSEAEWEHAARGGTATVYPWGDELEPRGRPMANTFRGEFPWAHEDPSGASTTPVGRFRPNGYGLVDVVGNVWEWTSSPWSETHDAHETHNAPGPAGCCAPSPASAPSSAPASAPSSARPEGPDRQVTKGGSHLCAPSYCRRYRPAARQGQATGTSTGHLGFRCVRDA